jgi:hypothetical protein
MSEGNLRLRNWRGWNLVCCSTGSASDIGENEPYVTTRQNSSTHTHHTAVDSKPLSPLAKKVALAAASKAALKAAASAKSTTTSPKGRHGSYAGEKAAALPTPKEKKAALALAKESKRILKRDKGARIVCLNCGSSNTPQWRMGPTGAFLSLSANNLSPNHFSLPQHEGCHGDACCKAVESHRRRLARSRRSGLKEAG